MSEEKKVINEEDLEKAGGGDELVNFDLDNDGTICPSCEIGMLESDRSDPDMYECYICHARYLHLDGDVWLKQD